MSTFEDSYKRALAAARSGEIIPESQLPKRGSSAWKALSSRDKRLVTSARLAYRDSLRIQREQISTFESNRWKNYIWKTMAGDVQAHALPLADYSPPTALSPARGHIEIVAGSRLGYTTLLKRLPASSGLHWKIKDLLTDAYYTTADSARKKAAPILRKIADGRKIPHSLPDDGN